MTFHRLMEICYFARVATFGSQDAHTKGGKGFSVPTAGHMLSYHMIFNLMKWNIMMAQGLNSQETAV